MPIFRKNVTDEISRLLHAWYNCYNAKRQKAIDEDSDIEPEATMIISQENYLRWLSEDICELLDYSGYEDTWAKTYILSPAINIIKGQIEDIFDDECDPAQSKKSKLQWIREHIPAPDKIETKYSHEITLTWDDWGTSIARIIKDKII